jgi:hypothetical protein
MEQSWWEFFLFFLLLGYYCFNCRSLNRMSDLHSEGELPIMRILYD